MKFMVIMKANEQSEAGQLPSTPALAEMGKYNEELVNAGIMRAGEGLHPSSKGARVKFSGAATPTVSNGPFGNTKELVAGFWIWETDSLASAIDWAKRIPNTDGAHHEVEIRQIFAAEDFGENFTPELRRQEEALRARTS